MTTTTKPRNGGLDWNVPRDGRASDAYEVACTAIVLHRAGTKKRGPFLEGITYAVPRHATRLHVISGLLHKLAERACNEDLTCRECQGEGTEPMPSADHRLPRAGESRREMVVDQGDCRACAGTGLSTGRKLESLRADAREIASHYGLSCYFQGDPRGCSLYIGEAKDMTDSTYNRGHAVTRLGR